MTEALIAQRERGDNLAATVLDSSLVSRNITVAGHRTSVRLEPEMWTALKEICHRERASLHEVCTLIAQHRRKNSSLTASIRVFIMAYYRAAATDEGHSRAGHGNGAPIGIAATIMPQTRPAAEFADNTRPAPRRITGSW